MRVIVCKECNKEKPYHCKGLCETCYDRLWMRQKRAKFKIPPKKISCPVCNTVFLQSPYNKKFCSNKCYFGDYNIKNRKKNIEKNKRYRERHPQKVRESWQKCNRENKEKRLQIYRNYRIKSGRSKTIFKEGMVNICKFCGNVFSPTKFVPYKKYCGSSCRSKAITKRWREKNPDKVYIAYKKYHNSLKGRWNVFKKNQRRRIYLNRHVVNLTFDRYMSMMSEE